MPSNQETALIQAIQGGDANQAAAAHEALRASLVGAGQNPPASLDSYRRIYGQS